MFSWLSKNNPEWIFKKYDGAYGFIKVHKHGKIDIFGYGDKLSNMSITYYDENRVIANQTGPSMIVTDGNVLYFNSNFKSKPYNQRLSCSHDNNTLYYFSQLKDFLEEKIISFDLIQLSTVPDLDGYILADAMEETGFDAQDVFTYLRRDPLEGIKFLEINPKDKMLFNAMRRVNKNIKNVLEFTKKKVIQDIQEFYRKTHQTKKD